jgi:hydroxymethylbilane synthase
MQKNIRIITRNSDLAMWQARHVAQKIKQLYPDIKTEIIGITTQGDRFLDTSLDKIGGKGLFIKELEQALINQDADIAVHSLKDLPANLTPIFTIAAILEREDSSDILLSNKYQSLQSIPAGAVIGTSSLRRSAILNRHYPSLHVKLLRGNILTRIKKLDNNEYDAIILAAAGVKRLNLEQRITQYLPKSIFIPSIGQGALAIECLTENEHLHQLMNKLTHQNTATEVMCERELGRVLQASCSVPIGAHAVIEREELSLDAIVLDKETGIFCTSRIIGHQNSYLDIARECANQLIQNGALKILQKYK